jgi:hypothetical protein
MARRRLLLLLLAIATAARCDGALLSGDEAIELLFGGGGSARNVSRKAIMAISSLPAFKTSASRIKKLLTFDHDLKVAQQSRSLVYACSHLADRRASAARRGGSHDEGHSQHEPVEGRRRLQQLVQANLQVGAMQQLKPSCCRARPRHQQLCAVH